MVIVSYGLWQGTFGGDAALIGKTLVLNDAPYTVVGILPPDFHFPWSEAQVWIPYRNYPNFTQQRDRSSFAAEAMEDAWLRAARAGKVYSSRAA